MTADDVQRWLDAYIAAWVSYDEADIAALFTEDAEYRYDAFRKPIVGSAATSPSCQGRHMFLPSPPVTASA